MQQAKEAGIQTLVMIDEQGGKQKSLLFWLFCLLDTEYVSVAFCHAQSHNLSALLV